MVALTRGLARALAPHVRVNGVSPGVAIFPESYGEQIKEKILGKVPLRRAGTPTEVAELVRFLVEGGAYITGQIIRIDGGRTLV
jgi:pteridine reductase